MRRIHVETNGNQTAKVFRDSDWNEYRIRLYDNGILNPDADGFEDDKDSAIATAKAMVWFPTQ